MKYKLFKRKYKNFENNVKHKNLTLNYVNSRYSRYAISFQEQMWEKKH